jgi:hypothetical protein
VPCGPGRLSGKSSATTVSATAVSATAVSAAAQVRTLDMDTHPTSA